MTWKERKKHEDQYVVSLGGKVKLLLVPTTIFKKIYKIENIISAVYMKFETSFDSQAPKNPKRDLGVAKVFMKRKKKKEEKKLEQVGVIV